jgi:hypothetical protein
MGPLRHTQYRSATIAAAILLAGAISLGACAQTQTTGTQTYSGGFLVAPSTVLVSDFDFAPDVVILDQALTARIKREMKGKPADAVKAEIAQQVGNTIAEAAVAALRDAGMKASLGSIDIALGDEPTLVITGRVRGIDQGNAAKRRVVGFGAGKSQVVADAQVTHVSTIGRRNVLNFTTEAESGKRPGAVARPARRIAGAVAGAAAGAVSEKLSGDVDALARRIGAEVAKHVIAFAGQQGWIRGPAIATPAETAPHT